MWGLLAVFAALSILGHLQHEPWRDEAQAWFIARDCPDVGAVLRITGYEGHPALWHLILRPFARAGLDFSSAAGVHFLIILSAVFLFLRNAPFSALQKALFVFGYYVLYEYNVLVRNYALAVLLLFALASLHPARFDKPLTYALLLALLANTNLFGLIIAGLLTAAGAFERPHTAGRAQGTRWAAALVLVAAGCAVSLYQIWPPADVLPPRAHTGQLKDSLFDLRLTYGHLNVIPRALVGAFLPLPQAGPRFWNTRLVHQPLQDAGFLDDFPDEIRWIYGILVICPAILSAAFLARKTVPFLIYLGASAGLLSVFFLIYEAGLRHHGYLFMLFLFVLWIGESYPENRLATHPAVKRQLGPKNLARLLTGLLAVHAAAAAPALYNDFKYDFSSGRRAAEFLKREGLLNERVFIATYPSKAAVSILLHADFPPQGPFMVEYQRPGSYMVWNEDYMVNQKLPADAVMERIDQAIAGEDYERVILITNSTVPGEGFRARYRLIASFNVTVDYQESFCIYELNPPAPGVTAGHS